MPLNQNGLEASIKPSNLYNIIAYNGCMYLNMIKMHQDEKSFYTEHYRQTYSLFGAEKNG